jgi:hypothetical protein
MPTFKNEITDGDIIQILLWLAAVIGLIFNYLQMRTNNRQKTAEHIINLNNQFASDKDLSDIYYEIEYGKFKYDPTFHQSERESKLDKLLDLYESMAKLYLLSNFTLKDMDYVAYSYLVVYQDSAVKSYLAFLDKWYKTRGMRVKPYSSFREVGQILETEYYGRIGTSTQSRA